METDWVSAQKSADGIVVPCIWNEGQNAERRKGIHKLRDGDESDQDEPHPGALWRNSRVGWAKRLTLPNRFSVQNVGLYEERSAQPTELKEA